MKNHVVTFFSNSFIVPLILPQFPPNISYFLPDLPDLSFLVAGSAAVAVALATGPAPPPTGSTDNPGIL